MEQSQIKATYPECISAAEQIGNIFGFDHDTKSIWADAINTAGMTSEMLEERTKQLITGWDKQTHYGKPTPADLIQGYQNDNGEYTGEQVGAIIGRMVFDRIGDENDQFQVMRSEIHNVVVRRLFEPVIENGQQKTKNGHRLFKLTQVGKQYATEIKQRIAPQANKRLVIERMDYSAFRDLQYIDARNAIQNASDLLFRPFLVVDR